MIDSTNPPPSAPPFVPTLALHVSNPCLITVHLPYEIRPGFTARRANPDEREDIVNMLIRQCGDMAKLYHYECITVFEPNSSHWQKIPNPDEFNYYLVDCPSGPTPGMEGAGVDDFKLAALVSRARFLFDLKLMMTKLGRAMGSSILLHPHTLGDHHDDVVQREKGLPCVAEEHL